MVAATDDDISIWGPPPGAVGVVPFSVDRILQVTTSNFHIVKRLVLG